MTYRFTLQKYKGIESRFTCPNCNTPRKFTRYIDTETDNYISEEVGRCDRESSCGYHYKPRDYFADNQDIKSNSQKRIHRRSIQIGDQSSEVKKISYIPPEILLNTLSNYDKNNFVRFLHTRFSPERIRAVISKYFIGTWSDGRTIFWQVDAKGKARTGKLMLYDKATGKRVTTQNVSWVHAELENEVATDSISHQPFEKGFRLSQCYFGEYLLAQNDEKPIGVVEGEKTAVVASIFLPKLIWIATGGCGNLKPERLASIIKGRQAFVFPDSSKYENWLTKIKKVNKDYGLAICVSDLLERRLSEEQKKLDYDLADFLLVGAKVISTTDD